MKQYDIGIIGGGPAGYTSALYAIQQGKSVVLFEKSELGGTCLNRGCIPTKILLHISQLYNEINSCEKLGIFASDIKIDYEKITEQRNKTIEKLRKSLELMIKKSGIEIVYQDAKIENDIIKTDTDEYSCKEIIIATGSKPKELKGLEYDGEFILSSDDILNLKALPQNILIVGSGAFGIEWARIFSAFGIETTVVELADRLCPLADWEVSKRIERQFKINKIKYYTETSISNIDNKTVTLSNGMELAPECILVAVGRETKQYENIENSKIKIIGDASKEIMLAHYAISQAKELLLDIPFEKTLVPSVIYGTPEIAWVGKVFGAESEEAGYDKVVLPISTLGKAHCDGCIDGFIKIISKDGLIVGASIVSNEASALIHQITIAIQNKIGVKELQSVCFAHPTYSEGNLEGIMQL